MKQKQKSLFRQFLLLVSVILLFAVSVGTIYQYQREKLLINENLLARGQSVGELLATMSVEPLLVYDVISLDNLTRDAGAQQDTLYVIVLGSDGRVISAELGNSSFPAARTTDSNASLPVNEVVRQIQENHDILALEFPVLFDSQMLGTVLVGLDRSNYLDAIGRQLAISLVTSLILGLVVGLGIYAVFRRKVSEPLAVLDRATHDIAHIKLDNEVIVPGGNEFSRLAASFNRMRLELKSALTAKEESLDELARVNEELEERVHFRTLELAELNAEMAHQAMHDPLTGLPNRLLIHERIAHAIAQARRLDGEVAILMLDLNNFKDINDTLGHAYGDELLQQVARRLPSTLRESDTVGRLGGDEFAIVLPSANVDEAAMVAQKISDCLDEGFVVEEQPLAVTASIGGAVYPDHGTDHSTLLRCADIAMYISKQRKSSFTAYDKVHDQHSPQRLSLVVDLRNAIEQNEIELYYQPIVDLRTGKVTMAEALLRWEHSSLGAVAPAEFVPIAENVGLINSLTSWVLESAIRQCSDWRRAGYQVRVSVNLSARNLIDPGLPGRLSGLISRYGVPAEAIRLEVTESAIMANPNRIYEIINHENLSGMSVAIDDFGTGYSSLSYLKKLPVTDVKIDRTFIVDMPDSDDDKMIVQAVIDLAHNLGHRVVAEGIENSRILEYLMRMKCGYGQGYLFSKAVRASELQGVSDRIEHDLFPRLLELSQIHSGRQIL